MPSAEVQIKSKMSISTDGVQTKAKQQGKKAGTAFSKQASKASKGLNLVGNKMLSGFKSFLQAGVIGTAIAGIGKIALDVFDNLTQSFSEKIKKSQAQFSALENEKQVNNDNYNQAKEYLKQLKELNDVQGLNMRSSGEMISLIDELQKKYGGLGFQIDAVTGKLTNLAEIEQKITSRHNAKQHEITLQQYQNIQHRAKISTNEIYKNGALPNTMAYWLNDQWNAMTGNLNTTNQGWQYHDMNLQGKKSFLEGKLLDAKTETEIDNISKQLTLVNQGLKLQNQIARMPLKDNTNLRLIDAERTKQMALQDQRNQSKEKFKYSLLRTDQEKMNYLNTQYGTNQQAIKNLQKINDDINDVQLQEDMKKWTNKRDQALNKFNATSDPKQKTSLKRDIQFYNNKITELQGELSKVAMNETDIEQLLNKQLSIQQQMEQIRNRQKNYFNDNITSLNNELQIQKLLLQGKYEQAQREKIIADLKKQGIDVKSAQAQQYINQATNSTQLLGKIRAENTLQEMGKNLYQSANSGDIKFRVQRAIENIEKQNGVKLSSTGKNYVQRLIKLQQSINDKTRYIPQYEVKTTELSARGGWKQGVSVTLNYDKTTAANTTRATQLLNEINNAIQRGGII